MLPSVLFLGGCSGLDKFFHDTVTLPGMNPNLPSGLSENQTRSEGHGVGEVPLLPEPGNVWPGPPQPLPTLGDVSREQGNGLGGDSSTRTPLGGSASGGPSLRDGNSMGIGENDAIEHGAPTDTISGSGSPGAHGSAGDSAGGNSLGGNSLGSDGFGGAGGSLADHVGETPPRTKPGNGDGGGNGKAHAIVIPNGDGTSTVIGPDGSVQTVTGTPK
ncbi:hypothetical protein [Lichenicoccus sp.]|uniref:hypothetical protein n=1 Tax=Lichenicoccus sp. TaxID=2781899 RepID=UPI003D1425C6